MLVALRASRERVGAAVSALAVPPLVVSPSPWKLGAVPVPVRWDVPDWEFARLREVIDQRVYLSSDDLNWIAATADRPVPDLPDIISPQTQGICSSGSTETPKVVLADRPCCTGAASMPPSLVHRWAGLIGSERIMMAYGGARASVSRRCGRRVAGASG
jgi:hypothetical protein